MKKSQDIIGLPVFSVVAGKKIGQVQDMVLNPEQGKIEFILVSNGNWYSGAKALPFSSAIGIGEHAVTIESENQLSMIDEKSLASSLLQRNIEVKGTRILSNRGNFIGSVNEYEVDESTGRITRIEYASADDDAQMGWISGDDVLTYGSEVFMFRERTAESLLENKLQDKTEAINKAPIVSESSDSEGTALFKERQKQFLLGKMLIQDIRDDDGMVLFPEGTTVTEEIYNLAEQKGKFIELSQCAR